MGHRHEERPLQTLGLGELRHHPAEPLGEQRDLVAAATLRYVDVVAAGGDVLRRTREPEHRLGQPAGQPPEEHSGERDAGREREREATEEDEPLLAQLGDRLRDDEPAEWLGSRREADRLRRGEEPPIVPGRRELERHEPVTLEPDVSERVTPQPLEAESLAREDRLADVVQLVAGRELERLRRELRRLRPFVARLDRGLRVERGQALRLAFELARRLRPCHVLEQPHRERDRDEPEHEDGHQEEGRQPESERPQHPAQGTTFRGEPVRPRPRASVPMRPCSRRPRR